ncbi:MAG: HAMP domain-containing histidine kinase [Lachnospiraceae bacterium]|nr:HAMP domain-containing histidine kinase [Lachnospiraceae bacterium]
MDRIAIACIGLLSFLCIALLVNLLLIRRNIRIIAGELKRNREKEYDHQLQIELNDRDLNELSAELNRNLDYQKELKRREEEARRQLERSVSDIAHDMRTPLTVIKGNLQMLAEEELSTEGKQYLEVSSRKAEALKGMVDEFFELSVLESDDQPVSLKKLDIVSFLAGFVIDHESMIREKELTPEIDFPEKSVFVNANEELCSRVFSNLLGNICKYAKGAFRISVSADDALVTVSNKVAASDEIDPEHIFERTYRADKARREGSAGLGLYIAKLLMEKQKGSITAEIRDGEIFFELRWS